MRAPVSILRDVTLALVTLALTLLASGPAAAKDDPKAAPLPDRDKLAAREKALRRSDTHGAATAELAVVRRWLVLARWAGAEGDREQQRRQLGLAALQLDLAQRLVSLARLRAEVDRLRRTLERTKKAIVDDRQQLKKRSEYLDVLRSTR